MVERHQERLIFKQVESQARILFKQIVLTRRWIADHGGIFVEKLPWVEKNPYLKKSEIIDITGKRYIKENPAFVTRELSEYSKKEGLYWFHITSLKLVNPANAPDEFETIALKRFETEDIQELTTIQNVEGSKLFRFIAPLYVEPPCLSCHPGYRLGDVRGAISVTIPINHVYTSIRHNRIIMAVGTLFISFILLSVLYLSLRKLVIKPITGLKEALENYHGGNYINIKARSEDEIGVLYKSFSEMMKTVMSYQNSLKEKVQDATKELMLANEKLLETNKLYRELSERKSDFISRISHELRTPLTSIKGAVDYINKKLTSHKLDCENLSELEELLTFTEIISSNTERLTRMVNETLDLEKIETGRMELHFNDLELSHIIKGVLIDIMPILDKKRISLKTELESELFVCADEDRIKQVLVNLLNNAVQHSPEGDEITIEAYKTGEWVAVRVADNGPGIPPEKHKKVFQMFYKERQGGTGLGLAISKSIIETHGGEIGVISDGIKGSVFYFKLPFVKGKNGTVNSGCR